MSKLRITVAGTTNSGKTTVAQAISKMLHEHGLSVVVEGDEPMDYHVDGRTMEGILGAEVVVDEITIFEKQVVRGGSEA